MKIAFLAIPCAAALSGCVMFMNTPPDLARIRREHADSGNVTVRDVELVRWQGSHLLVGNVGRLRADADTTQTHLDVTLFAADDSILRSDTTEFSPRQIYPSRRTFGYSSRYQIALDPLPSGLARIQVRAHDGPHVTP